VQQLLGGGAWCNRKLLDEAGVPDFHAADVLLGQSGIF
jgi:hypothetical protein